MKITEEIKEQIINLHKQNMTKKEIIELTSKSKSSINKIIKKYEEELSKSVINDDDKTNNSTNDPENEEQEQEQKIYLI